MVILERAKNAYSRPLYRKMTFLRPPFIFLRFDPLPIKLLWRPYKKAQYPPPPVYKNCQNCDPSYKTLNDWNLPHISKLPKFYPISQIRPKFDPSIQKSPEFYHHPLQRTDFYPLYRIMAISRPLIQKMTYWDLYNKITFSKNPIENCIFETPGPYTKKSSSLPSPTLNGIALRVKNENWNFITGKNEPLIFCRCHLKIVHPSD